MPKGNIRKWPIVRIFVLGNLAAICGLYYYVVQHFTPPQQTTQLRLVRKFSDVSHQILSVVMNNSACHCQISEDTFACSVVLGPYKQFSSSITYILQ